MLVFAPVDEVHDRGLGGWKRRADSSDLAIAAERIRVGDGRGFGESVAFHEFAPGQFFEANFDLLRYELNF